MFWFFTKFLDVVKTPLLTLTFPLLRFIWSFKVEDLINPCLLYSIVGNLNNGFWGSTSVWKVTVLDLDIRGEKDCFFSEGIWVEGEEIFAFWRFFMASFKFLFSSMKLFNIFSLFCKAMSLNCRRYLNDSRDFWEVESSSFSFLKISWQFLQISLVSVGLQANI